ncbi:MAG: hypothetical protein R6X22_00185 [Gemmatimonadota bacterium]
MRISSSIRSSSRSQAPGASTPVPGPDGALAWTTAVASTTTSPTASSTSAPGPTQSGSGTIPSSTSISWRTSQDAPA